MCGIVGVIARTPVNQLIYDALLREWPSPVVALNRAVVLAEVARRVCRTVGGCAVVVEALTVPPGSGEVPSDPEAAAEYAASHPDRQEARIVAGALRGGQSFCAIRQRAHDEDDLVLAGDDLVPALLELLHATLEPDAGDPQADE